MPENLSTKISAPIFEVVTPTVIFPVNGLVPIPSVDFTVDTPTVILSIAILAFEVKSVAVVAVPITSPSNLVPVMIPEMTLDTSISGVPLKERAVEAVPTTSPSNEVAVIIPVITISSPSKLPIKLEAVARPVTLSC